MSDNDTKDTLDDATQLISGATKLIDDATQSGIQDETQLIDDATQLIDEVPQSSPQEKTQSVVSVPLDSAKFDSSKAARPKQSCKNRVMALVAVLIVGAMLVGGAVFVAYGAELWGGKTVPRVAGLSQANATKELEDCGFTVSYVQDPVDDGIGIAIKTEPESGTRLAVGSKVVLHIGSQRIIPQLIGLDENSARTALREAGAQSIAISYVASEAAEGSVIDVDPKEGSAFVSRDTITLSIAQPYTVPYVVGKTEDDARAALEAAGLQVDISYVSSGKEPGTVVACDPAQGMRISAGETVHLQVSEPNPSDYHHLVEYFDFESQRLDAWLQEKGFGLQVSHVNPDGMALALYNSNDKGSVIFSSNPFAHNFYIAGNEDAYTNALGDNRPFEGVRLDFAAGDILTTDPLSDASIQHYLDLCGFKNVKERVTQDTIVFPESVARVSTEASEKFVCVYGTEGAYSWSVLVVNGPRGVRAAASCALTSLYDRYDIASYGGSIAQFIAYIDVYTG